MNNEQRETKEVKVGEHNLVVNTYITGREARNIESAMMDKLEMNQNTGEKGMEVKGFKASLLKDKQDKQVEAVVVSVNGNSTGVLDLILDLPSTESEEIMRVVAEVAEPKKEEASS